MIHMPLHHLVVNRRRRSTGDSASHVGSILGTLAFRGLVLFAVGMLCFAVVMVLSLVGVLGVKAESLSDAGNGETAVTWAWCAFNRACVRTEQHITFERYTAFDAVTGKDIMYEKQKALEHYHRRANRPR